MLALFFNICIMAPLVQEVRTQGATHGGQLYR